MNRVLLVLFGPEVFWVAAWFAVRAAARRSVPPDPAITAWLDRYWAVLPLIIVPLTFAYFLSPAGGRWWMLLRIDVAIVIGLALATTKYCEAMTYHEPSSGPGAGTAFMLMIAFGYFVMIVGTVIAVVTLWWRARVAS